MASYSSEIVANNDDLLLQILLKLPLKSLIKVKSVSKHWQSLISDISFPCSVSGLFLESLSCRMRKYFLVDLNQSSNSSDAHIQSFTFTNPSGIRIIDSCNGLLLCSGREDFELNNNYYVYNPTTKKYTVLPPVLPLPFGRTIWGLNLAFDPSKSPFYKVLCIWSSYNIGNQYQIEIYSSETRTWRLSGVSFDTNTYPEFMDGVFWNGFVHWPNIQLHPFLYFNVDEERLSQMPSPPLPENMNDGKKYFRYFGKSRGHLHLVCDLYNYPTPHFVVYEMEMDYSGWFVKYRIDCSQFPTAFPEIIPSHRWDFSCYQFSIVCTVRGDVDEESYAVIRIAGNVIRYNFKSQVFHKLAGKVDNEGCLSCWSTAHEYIESLALV